MLDRWRVGTWTATPIESVGMFLGGLLIIGSTCAGPYGLGINESRRKGPPIGRIV